MLLIIDECDPLALSNLSLVNKSYYSTITGSSTLRLLSKKCGVDLESFSEYQLLCEIRCLVPQSIKHYTANFLLCRFLATNNLEAIDSLDLSNIRYMSLVPLLPIVTKETLEITKEYARKMVREEEQTMAMYYLDIACGDLSSIGKVIEEIQSMDFVDVIDQDYFITIIKHRYIYEERVHTTGSIITKNNSIEKLFDLVALEPSSHLLHLSFLLEYCPDMEIIIEYWNTYVKHTITDNNVSNVKSFMLPAAVNSCSPMERMHWVLSVTGVKEFPIDTRMFINPCIIDYMNNPKINGGTYFCIDGCDACVQEVSDNYKYGERINKLMMKIKW